MKILFAHGLEGSPNGSKPTWMKESLGWEVICPEMSKNGWTIADQTEVIAEAISKNEDIDVIMGSSYGGLAIANASERFAERNLRLVLLAPAFGLAENFRSVAGEQGLIDGKILVLASISIMDSDKRWNSVGISLHQLMRCPGLTSIIPQ